MSVEEVLNDAKQRHEARRLAGFDQAALDAAARQGFGNGAFEDSEEEGESLVEEFFARDGEESATGADIPPQQGRERSSLQAKLDAKAGATTTA